MIELGERYIHTMP